MVRRYRGARFAPEAGLRTACRSLLDDRRSSTIESLMRTIRTTHKAINCAEGGDFRACKSRIRSGSDVASSCTLICGCARARQTRASARNDDDVVVVVENHRMWTDNGLIRRRVAHLNVRQRR